MDHIVIGTDGTFEHRTGDLDWDAVIGPEGRNRVRLHPAWEAAGWVNDCGLLVPERYPRNVVGSCVLVALGAALQPYADIHRQVTAALNNRPVRGDYPADWEAAVRDVAAYVRTCPTPHLTFHRVTSLEDVL